MNTKAERERAILEEAQNISTFPRADWTGEVLVKPHYVSTLGEEGYFICPKRPAYYAVCVALRGGSTQKLGEYTPRSIAEKVAEAIRKGK